MNNPNHGGRAGVRESATRFLQTVIVNKVNSDIASGLCWGYSLGFTKRLYSDARGVPWLNMGIANAMQFAIVPNQKKQNLQRTRVTDQLKRHGSLLGLLRATKLEQERWPTCCQIVRFLIATDPIAFGQTTLGGHVMSTHHGICLTLYFPPNTGPLALASNGGKNCSRTWAVRREITRLSC